MTESECNHGNLRAEIVASAVDENGDPDSDIRTYGIADIRPYYCLGCNEEFEDWEEAVRHIGSAVRTPN